MEAETQRWAAMYTKHLKQKRKAYHDGTLLFHPDSGRLVLLDDAGDNLESRYLRASEEVSAGAALSFHSYLVDVGELEVYPAGSRSSSSSPPVAAASRTAHRSGARARPPSAAGRLNPRVPRAFVNPPNSRGVGGGREDEAAGPGVEDEASSRSQEWLVLYTAQLTQKAKKYHDGVVRLVKAGPNVMQIVLLDEDGQKLGSRHLKSGETIESGKKFTFPNYLIEICEARNEEGIHTSEGPMLQTSATSGGQTSNKMGLSSASKPQKFISPQSFHVLETESNVAGSSGKPETGKAEVVASGSSGSLMQTHSSFKEWSALYTTQLTQKAKKYHDGVIRLVVGSHSRQIVLLDEEGEELGRRYLRSVESIESGKECQIPNYLIQVCELRNQKNEGKHSLEEVSQTCKKSEENLSEKMGVKSRSPKFVSPFKFQDARKRNCESTTIFTRPPIAVGKTACNNMNSYDIQRGTSTNSVWPEVGKSLYSNVGNPPKFHDFQDDRSRCPTDFIRKEVGISTFGNMDDSIRTDIQMGTSTNSVWPEVGKSLYKNVGDPPKFHDFQDGKSRWPTEFIRKEAGISTFGNMDDSIRTASQILSIMKPPSELKLPQSAPSGPARSLVSSNSTIPFDASHTNNNIVDDSNRTFDGRGHSGFSHFSTHLHTSVQSCLSLDASHTNNYVVDDSNRTFDGSSHSALSHFATELRTSVQSCLSLETPLRKNSVMADQWSVSSGNSHPTQDIMRPAAFESQDLTTVDTLASDISNAKGQKLDSSCHNVGSSNDLVPSDTSLQEDKSGTSDELSTENSVLDGKRDGRLSTSTHTLTCKDPRIQELIDDCPSFDLGFERKL